MKHSTARFTARVLQRLVGARAISAYRLSAEVGALLRREDLHAVQLEEWRTAAETALEDPSRRREKPVPHPDTKRLADVERDLRRK